jgi:uncharacterized membrane protein YbhN (UPF0104 family)
VTGLRPVKQNYLRPVILIVVFLALAAYLANLAISYMAFPEREPWFGILELRFVVVGTSTLLAFAVAVALTVRTIKRMNREYREQISFRDHPK